MSHESELSQSTNSSSVFEEGEALSQVIKIDVIQDRDE
jgi:hypothetical protein